jgi:CDP-diacylglycerol--glycerol-3-phosphate 3-phosphatidyltransferase
MAFVEQKVREVSRKPLEAVARALDRVGVSPNMMTYFGLLLTAVVAVLAGLGEIRWAGVAYFVSAIGDAMDGTLARVSGKGSRFGAFLDSSIDRFEESIVFLGLIIYYNQLGGGYEIPLILIVTVGSLMVSYTRARAEALGVACKVGFMTRIPRVTVMIVGMLLDQMLITLAILAVTTLITALHRMYHVMRMSGGEKNGWGPVQEPFFPPVSPVLEGEGESK